MVVTVNEAAGGLDADLLILARADERTAAGIDFATPLRAFGAKMLDIIEAQGLGDASLSPAMREMLLREKATQDLKRIEGYARGQAAR